MGAGSGGGLVSSASAPADRPSSARAPCWRWVGSSGWLGGVLMHLACPVATAWKPDRVVEVRPGWQLGEEELRWRFSRSSGPGGQGVNTTDSRAEVVVDLAGSPSLATHPVWRERALAREGPSVRVVASAQRSQLQNRQDALARLVARLRAATDPPPPRRRTTRPSRGAVERRLADKRRQTLRKQQRRTEE